MGDENAVALPPILTGKEAMQRSRPTLHLFGDRLANEKKRLEAQLAQLQPGPERDQLLQKLRQLDTALHIDEWLSSPGLQSPTAK
jgi:hypothetical protein